MPENAFTIAESTFTLRSKPATIVGLAPQGAQLAVADANRWTSVQDLLASAGKPADLPVVVGQAALQTDRPIYLALQRVATAVDQSLTYKVENLPRIFDSAERHRRALAEKVVADTPDPFINAAVAALCIAADGVWDEPGGTVMHGAVAWRAKLLGWRGPYATTRRPA